MHAANIAAHPRAELGGVFDVHRPAAEEVAASLNARIFESAEAVLASADVDAVLIAEFDPDAFGPHRGGGCGGKPVLCEKPIDLSLARVTLCAERIRGASVPIMLGFVRRFDPGHRAVQQAVRNGLGGRAAPGGDHLARSGPGAGRLLEESGGIFRDMTIHDFDMARFISARR